MACKPDVADDRGFVSSIVLSELASAGAEVHVVALMFDAGRIGERGFTPVVDLNGEEFDVAVILTANSGVDCVAVAQSASIVLNTRNIYGRLSLAPSNVRTL